jgi:hypothetical protein
MKLSKLFHTIRIVTVLFSGAVANAGENDTPIQSVEVKGIRTGLVPYKELYELAKKVQLATAGRVAVGLRLVPARPRVRVDNVKLWLERENESLPIPVSDGGIFIVPVNDEIAANDGRFAINKQKGDLTARIVVLPTMARDAWTIGAVRQSIADARAAIDKFTPWYQKPFAMRVNTVSVCTRKVGVPVKIMQGETVIATLSTSEQARNDADQPVYCQHFKGDENYGQASVLSIPEEAEVLFL